MKTEICEVIRILRTIQDRGLDSDGELRLAVIIMTLEQVVDELETETNVSAISATMFRVIEKVAWMLLCE